MSLLFEDVSSLGTPVSSFSKLLDERCPVLLDSGMDHQRLGRFSYATADPFAVIRCKADRVDLETRSGPDHRYFIGSGLAELRSWLQRISWPTIPELPPFQGGAIGYLSYDFGRQLERLPVLGVDDQRNPDLCFGLYDWVLAHDHQTGRTWLLAGGDGACGTLSSDQRMRWALERMSRPAHKPVLRTARRSPLQSNFTRPAYVKAVRAVKEYIAAGDVYQVNLSQRFQMNLPVHPWELYLRLRTINPAPFAAYLDFGDLAVLSASPEQFLRLQDGLVETRPIKGTRPRGDNHEQDRRMAEELSASEKDRAENLMIVDLLRNDLGRVCQIGSISVPELFALEAFPTVFHLVSTVVGRLRPDRDRIDLLAACLPGGSITGAPKIRAMEIIEELEPTWRSVYCGSIGYLGFNDTMNTSIVIRTMLVKNETVTFQVGGGIVADSDPEEEYQETLDKGRALIRALEMDADG